MSKLLSIILVAALATTSAFAAKPRYYGSTTPKSYAVTKSAKDRTTAADSLKFVASVEWAPGEHPGEKIK